MDADRLATSAVAALGLFVVGMLAVAFVVALFTGGWYFTVGGVLLFVLWAAIYRWLGVKR